MSFDTGLSGLNSASKALDVIGNNVANSNTVGFKNAQAHFADIYAATLSAATPSAAPGLGANAASIVQSFRQGGISMTGNPLDVAINGQGFFRINDNGAVTYTRNGQFRLVGEPVPAGKTLTPAELDKQKSLLVNSDGLHVTGYVADATGAIVKSSPQDILIDPVMLASATTKVALSVNLDAKATQMAAPFDPANSGTYNGTTASKVYDAQGNIHNLAMYFVSQPAGWDLYTTLDGVVQPGPPDSLTFDTSGQLTAAMPLAKTFALAGGASLPVTLDLTGSTQYGSSRFGVNALTQDGYPEGRMRGLTVAADGTLQARYTNDQIRGVAQLVLAKFANPNGLVNMGNNQWTESQQSGAAQLDTPGNPASQNSLGLGVVQGGGVEEANVDLNNELVAMIVQQRFYQANAQSIKAQDQILQTLAAVR